MRIGTGFGVVGVVDVRGVDTMDGPERLSIPMAVEPRFARMVVAPVVWLPFFFLFQERQTRSL